ncbi:MAG: hypothetical protein H6733_16645 [Alphaproteobacteria bacterium]|nr:hypothetical protein [Alphaproteobacteria bacterium]
MGLPPTQSVLLKLLFVGVEWLTPLLAPIGGRFSRRTPEGRVAVVEGWRGSWVFPVRLLGDAVRATLMMVYFSHPDVLLALGEGEPGTTLAEAG